MSVGSKILRASLLRACDLSLLLGATLFVTPLLVHSLGARIYGFFMLVGAIADYYGFLDLGLSAAATKYMSEAVGKDDTTKLTEVASTAHFLFILVAAAVMAATVLTALACPLFLRDRGEVAVVRELIVIMGGAAAIVFPARVYIGMLSARIRYDYLAAISIARTIVFNGAVYACLRAHRGVIAIAILSVVGSLAQRAAIIAVCRARYPELKIVLFKHDRRTIREMFDYGVKLLVCQMGDILRFQLDPLVIATFLGAAMITPYAVGAKLVTGLTKLVTAFTGTMLPVFSQYHGRGDYDAIRGTLLKATRFSSTVAAFLGLSIIFYGRAFIRRWMGPGFDHAYFIAAALAAAQVIDLPQAPGVQLLYGVSKHKFYAVLSVWEGVINLALSVALIKPFGIYGVALGTLLEVLVFKLVILPIYICRVAGLSVRGYLFDAILLTQLKAAIPLALFFYAVSRFAIASYGALAACVIVQTALFVPVAYAFILGEPERRTVLSAARGIIEWPPVVGLPRSNEEPVTSLASVTTEKVQSFFDVPDRYLRARQYDIRLRKETILEFVGEIKASSILDVGCGDGSLSLPLLNGQNRLTLLDLSNSMLSRACARVPDELRRNICTVNDDFLRASLKEHSYDVILCVGLLAHLTDPSLAIAKIVALAKPGASIIVELNDYRHFLTHIFRSYERLRGLLAPEPYQLNDLDWEAIRDELAFHGASLAGVYRYSIALPGMRRVFSQNVLYRGIRAIYGNAGANRNRWLGNEFLLHFKQGNTEHQVPPTRSSNGAPS